MASTPVEDKIEDYLIANYKTLIPQNTKITFDILLDPDKREYGDDIFYGGWDRSPVHLNTELSLDVWIGTKCYNVMYDIYWKIDSFPEENYYECHGSKCRRNINLSFDHWCASCHGEPHETYISRMVEIYVKGEEAYDIEMTFGRISQFIQDVDIISYEEIETPDEMRRTQQIIQQMEFRRIQLENAEREIISLRERKEHIYAEFGFESKEAMEKFMTDSHKRAADKLIQSARAKLSTLSVTGDVVSGE
jgi:hypothetical protein